MSMAKWKITVTIILVTLYVGKSTTIRRRQRKEEDLSNHYAVVFTQHA